MIQLYLSRRNLLALLHKLDRAKATPGSSACTIVKQDMEHPKYPSGDVVVVTALEDAEYYTDREPGKMHPKEEAKMREGLNPKGPRFL